MSDKTPNPSNVADLPADFRPMNSPTLRLSVPEKAGYHRHWFRGTKERIARAQQAGYRFVDEKDTKVNNRDLAGASEESGNSDMGSRVSVVSGDDFSEGGQPSRLYLMECPEHLYRKSQEVIEERNDSVADALRGGILGAGASGENSADMKNRYVQAGGDTSLFTPKTRR